MTKEEQKSCLKMQNRCLLCGRSGHYASNCQVKTTFFLCKGSHWTGFCPNSSPLKSSAKPTKGKSDSHRSSSTSKSKPVSGCVGKGKQNPYQNNKDTEVPRTEDTVSTNVAVKTAVGNSSNGVALPTAIVTVGPKGKGSRRVKIRSFFDTGAQKSFIHPDVVRDLGLQPKGETVLQLLTFGQESGLLKCHLVDLTVSLGRRVANVEFIVTDRVSTTLTSPGLTATVANLKQEGIRLADKYASDKMLDIQAVIGCDNFSKFVNGIKTLGGINLLCSPGGHIIYGALPFGTSFTSETTCQRVVISKVGIGNCEVDARNVVVPLEPKVEQLWELEAIGIKEENYSPDERNALQIFGDSIQYCDNQYWVKFPWKILATMLPTNYRMAVGQYNSLRKHLKGNLVKMQQYGKVFRDYLSQGFIERVDETEVKGHFPSTSCCA